jgi:hypothetical protein
VTVVAVSGLSWTISRVASFCRLNTPSEHLIKGRACSVVRRLYVGCDSDMVVVMPHGWISLENNHSSLRVNTKIDTAKFQSYLGHELRQCCQSIPTQIIVEAVKAMCLVIAHPLLSAHNLQPVSTATDFPVV